jgi:hypothetical protein
VKTGLFVPLKTRYYLDAKILEAGEAAELLYVRALGFVKEARTDGIIYASQLPFLGLTDPDARAKRLVEAGLWELVPGGFRIVSWLKHNDPEAVLQARSEAFAAGGRKGGLSRGSSHGLADACAVASDGLQAKAKPSGSGSGCTAVTSTTPGAHADARDASPVPPSEQSVAVSDAADDEPAVVSDWAADDPTYEADPRYSAQAELELWEARVGPIQPRDAMMSATALIRLHLHCKRSVREIRALIEHVAADPDARKWWGAGKSPARWLSSRDGGEPTWCKIRAHWQGAGGKLHGNGKIRRIEIPPGPAPAVDPACDCRRGFITVDGHREGCPKCSRGKHIRAGGRL